MSDHEQKQEFLAASVAVWREIDRLSAEPDGYPGLDASTDLRRRERDAWEAYRAVLDAADDTEPAPSGDQPRWTVEGDFYVCRMGEDSPMLTSIARAYMPPAAWEALIAPRRGSLVGYVRCSTGEFEPVVDRYHGPVYADPAVAVSDPTQETTT